MRGRAATLVACLLLILGAGPLGAAADDDARQMQEERGTERGPRAAARNIGQDGRYLLSFPSRPTRRGLTAASAVLAGVGVLILLDDEIRERVQEARGEPLDRWEQRIEPLGDARTTALGTLLVWAGGKLARDPGVTETGRTLACALLFTEAFQVAGKGLIGRSRPSPSSRASDFEPFSSSGFFPSGHAARTFAVAAVLAERHGAVAARAAYPIATLVALFRIESDSHWASDVLAGAALGWGVGHAVARQRDRRRAGPPVTVSPALFGDGRAGLVLQASF